MKKILPRSPESTAILNSSQRRCRLSIYY